MKDSYHSSGYMKTKEKKQISQKEKSRFLEEGMIIGNFESKTIQQKYKDLKGKILSDSSQQSSNLDHGYNSENNNETPQATNLSSTRTSDILKLDSLITYFNIQESDNLTSLLEENGLDLFIMLDGYKNFIEKNLSGLNETIKNKIKESISIKIGSIYGIITDLKSNELDTHGNLNNFKNNRWILNHKIMDLFSDINDKILPNAFFLQQYNNSTDKENFITSTGYKRRYGRKIGHTDTKSLQHYISEINEMFHAQLDDSGDFNEGVFSIQDVLSTNTVSHKRLLKKIGTNSDSIQDINLLSEKDKKIELEAMKFFMIAIATQITIEVGPAIAGTVVPILGNAVGVVGGAVVGGTIDFADMFSDTEALLDLVQSAGLVNPDYRMEKTWIDKVLAGVDLLPGMTIALKSQKISQLLNQIPQNEIIEGILKIIPIMMKKMGRSKTPPINVINNTDIIIPAQGNTIPDTDSIDFKHLIAEIVIQLSGKEFYDHELQDEKKF